MSEQADGYRGIWFELNQKSRYGDKYSGGLGTYTAKHVPLAVYEPRVNKTFFVYGGTRADEERHLLAMIGCYDHATGTVGRPTIVHDKQGVDDPHDNPSLTIDPEGHILVFVAARSRKRMGYIYRSRRPFEIDDFELLGEHEICYPQPWLDAKGRLILLHTRYTGVRELYWMTSDDGGRTFTQPQKLAGMDGHYQVSRGDPQKDGRIITAFNYHPAGNPDWRTNLYFAQTRDLGKTWKSITDQRLELPMVDTHCPALVRDFAAEGRLVYMKDIELDANANPVVLIITSSQHEPGPTRSGQPRTWTVVRWTGKQWTIHPVTNSTHNYDMGSLDLSDDGDWRIIAPTEPGPQHWATGGEMALWRSSDQGRSWQRQTAVTANSPRNHAYARRPIHAHLDFAAFWADGDPDQFSNSHLYCCRRDGTNVRQLPATMDSDAIEPRAI